MKLNYPLLQGVINEEKNMSRKSSVGLFIGAVLVSFALAYFLLPILQPTTGTIRQTKFVESRSLAYLLDSETTLKPIPEITTTMTVNDKSSLTAVLSSGITMTVDSAFSGIAFFEISIVIQGVGNRTAGIEYASTSVLNSTIKFAETFYIEYRTGPLAAGTYNVTAYWLSLAGATHTGSAQISMTTGTGVYNYTRTLVVQEITG